MPSMERVSEIFTGFDKGARLGWFSGVRERPVYLHTFAEEHGGAVMGAGLMSFIALPVRRVMRYYSDIGAPRSKHNSPSYNGRKAKER